MLLSHCPNCQHDNPPGERFCAACGVPLDLKPCAVCGKVDNIKATVCTGCGAQFPDLSTLLGSEAKADAPVAAKPIPPLVSPPPTTMRALPLIVVALAAGGIPLLWLYRNTMPVPKVWQAQPSTPEATVPASQEPKLAPTTTTASGQISPSAGASAPSVPPSAPPTPLVTEKPEPAAPAPADKPVAPPKPASKPATKVSSTPTAPKPATTPAASECTEALAAVGLCAPTGER
jgi:hypothetical protein